MSATAVQIKAAIQAAVASIAPTIDPSFASFRTTTTSEAPIADQPATNIRRFEVVFGGGQLGDVHNLYEDECVETILIRIRYPATGNFNHDDDRCRSDVADVKRQLDATASWLPAGVTHQIVQQWSAPELDRRLNIWTQIVRVIVRFLQQAEGASVPAAQLGGAATPSLGPSAGVGAVIAASAAYDKGGSITIVMGSSPGADGVLFSLLLSRTYEQIELSFQAGDDDASDADLTDRLYVTTDSGRSFDVNINGSGPPLTQGVAYTIRWVGQG